MDVFVTHLADKSHVFVFTFFTDAHKLLGDQSLALETLFGEVFLCHFDIALMTMILVI